MAKKILNLDTDNGVESWGSMDADNVLLDTTAFDKNLDTTITDVQKLADAVDDLDLSSLPTPTANKLLRANGTDWVASVNTELSESTNGGKLEVKNLTYPTKKYFNVFVSNTDGGFVFSNDTPTEPEGNKTISGYISSTSTSFILRSKNSEIMQFVTYPNNYMQIGMNGNGAVSTQYLSIKTTNTYTATEKIFSFGNTFSIYQNGKIASNYLSGSGNQLIEATADGTIQRSTATIPAPQVNSDWNATEGVAQILNKPTIPTVPTKTEYLSGNLSGTEHTFTGTTLGITGDLRSRIKNIKCFAVDSSGNYNGALIANEFIYETDVTVNTTTNLSGSFRIKLFIEYA